MYRSAKLVCALSLSIASIAFTAEVLRVDADVKQLTISQDKEGPWEMDDKVSVIKDGEEIAYGTIVESTVEEAVVRLSSQVEDILIGDQVIRESELINSQRQEPAATQNSAGSDTSEELASLTSDSESTDAAAETSEPSTEATIGESSDEFSETTQRTTSSSPYKNMKRIELVRYHRDLIRARQQLSFEETTSYTGGLKRRFNVTLGGYVFAETTGNSVWPQIQFQSAVSRNYTIGLTTTYSGFTTLGIQTRGVGVIGTVTYYPLDPYNGVHGLFGVGLSSTRVTNAANQSGSVVPWNVLLGVGWRWLLDESVNIGLEAGGQYFNVPKKDSITSGDLLFFAPVFLVDIGFAF